MIWARWIKKIFGQSKTVVIDPMKYLIAGLGNMGAEYDNTRHNIGFDIVDHLAARFNAEFKDDYLGDLAEFRHKGRTFVLLKPSTFMNRSGKSVRYWLQKKKIQRSNLLVIVDDMNLPFGKLRLRKQGSDGGHNGLKDVAQMLSGQNYARLRVGIGRRQGAGGQIDHVLGNWDPEEADALPKLIDTASDLVLSFGTIGIERTMNTFNN